MPVLALALDGNNRPAFTYSGTVNVTTTNTNDTFPSTVTFQNGYATFQVSFAAQGSDTLTITDTLNSKLTGQTTVKVTAPAVAAKYDIHLVPPTPSPVVPPIAVGGQPPSPISLMGVPNVPAGASVPVAVVALDSQNQPVTTYTGTANVIFSDKGTGAICPATVTFVNGLATFNVTFVTAGPQSVIVTDQTNPSLTATLNVNVVVPAVAAKYDISSRAARHPGRTAPGAGFADRSAKCSGGHLGHGGRGGPGCAEPPGHGLHGDGERDILR